MERPAIDVESLRSSLSARWPRIDVVEQTSSTNADLIERIDPADRTVLIAEHQVAGRGRFDREWNSPARAGLTFSVLLRPDVPLASWGWLPLLTGTALAEAVRDETGVQTALKWPNDLLVGDAKAAGILAQTAGDAVVIGIGLNVSTTAEELPVATATSLQLAGAERPDRTRLLIAILERLDARAAQWNDCGGDAAACGLDVAYRSICSTLGTDVRVAAADGSVVEGRAEDLDGFGHLVVRTGEATLVLGAGDVEHLRPA
ncbi:MAG: biotin--[acetyl-CoA-carboxylase] ligase [Jatrophihabitans sp.]